MYPRWLRSLRFVCVRHKQWALSPSWAACVRRCLLSPLNILSRLWCMVSRCPITAETIFTRSLNHASECEHRPNKASQHIKGSWTSFKHACMEITTASNDAATNHHSKGPASLITRMRTTSGNQFARIRSRLPSNINLRNQTPKLIESDFWAKYTWAVNDWAEQSWPAIMLILMMQSGLIIYLRNQISHPSFLKTKHGPQL